MTQARGLETRRNGDLLGEGWIGLRIQKVDREEGRILRVLVNISPSVHSISPSAQRQEPRGCGLAVDASTV